MGVFTVRCKDLPKICEKFLKSAKKPLCEDLALSETLVMAAASSLSEAMRSTMPMMGPNRLKSCLPDDHPVSIEPVFMDSKIGRHVGFNLNLNNGDAPFVVNGWSRIKSLQKASPDPRGSRGRISSLHGVGLKGPCPAGAELMRRLEEILFEHSEDFGQIC